MDLKAKEKMYVRLIVFTLLLLMIVFYFEKILGTLQTILAICFPFIIGAGLAFVYNIIGNNIILFEFLKFKIPSQEDFL